MMTDENQPEKWMFFVAIFPIEYSVGESTWCL